MAEARIASKPLMEGTRLRSWFSVKTWTLIVVALIVAYLSLVPLIFLVWDTFTENGQFSLDAFSRAYEGDQLWTLVKNSLVYALGSTALSVAIGTTLAYMVVRTDIRFKGLFVVSALVPIIIPGLLYTIAWIILGSGRIGIINSWLAPIGLDGHLNVFSMPGMIAVQGMDGAALVFLLMYAGFKSMDPSLEESARMCGASLPKVFFRVTLPVNRPAFFAAVLVMFIRSIESFETPALLGLPSGIYVFTSRIWRSLQTFPPDYGEAGALSISLLITVSAGVYLYQRGQSQAKKFATVSGKGFRSQVLPLGRWRWPMTLLLLGYVAIGIVLPLLALLYMSTQSYIRPPNGEAMEAASLDNYRYVFQSDGAMTAFQNSVVLAFGTATLTMLLVAVASWIIVRSRVRGAWILDNLAFLPLVIPGLVLGIAMIFVYARLSIGIYGTMWILLIAFITKNMPYGIRASTTSMIQISKELEESAEMSGASWWQIFRRVLIPLLMPGLMAGWIFIMVTTLRELSSALLLYPAGGQVLAVQIWQMYDRGLFGELAALGVLMIAFASVIVAIAQKLGANFGVRP